MRKSRKKSQNKSGYPLASVGGSGQKLVDRDLCSISPNTTQFEPTPQSAIRQHKKMAGVE